MTATLLNAEIAKLIKDREGGFSHDPADRGGATMYGVTEKVARTFGYQGPMEDLPFETAVSIYKNQYFKAPNFDRVAGFSWAVALELFDTGINMGPAAATMFLQRCLNAMNNEGKAYPDLPIDGLIGPMTLAALQTFLLLRSKEGERVLLRGLNCLQGARYIELAEGDHTQEKFLYGWLNNRVA